MSIKTTVYNLDAAADRINKLNQLGIKFIHSKTSGTEKIEYIRNNVKQVYFYVENKNSEKFIQFINSIKTEIESNYYKLENNKYKFYDKKRNYFDFNESLYEIAKTKGEVFTFDNCYEADITAAYYRSAVILGLISEKTYYLCVNNISKSERLKLLGSIASIKIISNYENGNLIEPIEVKKSHNLRLAWFTICNLVDGCMKNFINLLGTDFIFYWVDGIYFKGTYNDSEKNLMDLYLKLDILKKHFDFEWKIQPLKKLELLNKGYLELQVTKFDDSIKPFFVPAKKIKGFYLK